jgi:hypothetical protein
MFFNNVDFIEAINGFREVNTDSKIVNYLFDAPTHPERVNFRLEYFSIIDKFLNEDVTSYLPNNIFKNVVISFI